MHRTFWTLVALVVGLSLLPSPVLAQDDPLVVGQHAITVQKGGVNVTSSVTEAIYYSVEENAFDGTLTFPLDPQADLNTWTVSDGSGTPLAGSAGQAQGDLPSESTEQTKEYRLDLAANNLTFESGETYQVRLFYTLPADDRAFTRGFGLPTPSLAATIVSTPGLQPVAEGLELRPLGSSWSYSLANEDHGPWVPGETFSFTFEETDVPREPLGVRLSASGTDPVMVTATASGGIAPYSFSWDTDGDGDCDDATGTSIEVDATSEGRHTVFACVTDARGSVVVRDSYEVRTLEGPTITTGPGAWLLALVGFVIGALIVYGLVAGGILGGRRGPSTATSSGRSLSAESKEMLGVRQRVMVAALKELEIAKKKGEVAEGLYTPLKAELKQDTVRVMRELEKRKSETV